MLTGFLAVDSETNSGQAGVRNPGYGRIRLLELPRSSNVPGPGQVQNYFNSNADVSQVLNVLGLQGSQVIKGNLLTLPRDKMNAEFISAIQQLEDEKGINKDILIEAVEMTLVKTYKKNFIKKNNYNDTRTGRR